MKRRTLLAASLGAALPLPLPSEKGTSFERRFAHPGTETGAKFRWWWPHGLVDPKEIAREVDQIADAGFGGVEIQDVHHSVRTDLDVEGHGWGTPAWLAAVETALRRAKARNLTVDLAMGPSWPTAVPTITPAHPAAAKELFTTVTPFTGSYSGTVEADIVQIARVVSAGVLDPASVKTLRSGQIDLVLEGDWVLLAYTERGSGQEPEGGPHTSPDSYVVDHFGRAGTDVVLDFWRKVILTRKIRELLRDTGGDLFEDSLEIETDETIWTPGFLREFERRAGYDLLPCLPIVVQKNEKYLYAFDSDTSNHVRDDVDLVLSDLYHENHLIPLRDFAHGLGMRLRVQPYGLRTDAVRSATLLDVPESESLGFKNLDDYRVLASGRDMAGHALLSCESAAYANGAYSTTWDKVLQTMGSVFAGGVNQAVLHGFAYATAPGAAWPGFAAFSPYNGNGIGYAEAWGPRQPTWRHVSDIAGWFARTQLVLRTGRARTDIAFFRQKGWTATGIGASWATNDGIPIGWTHGFLTESALDLPSAVVRGGRLAPDGPAYKALILEGDAFRGREHTISLRAARKLLALARAGLPIIVLGDWSSDAHVTGLAAPGENAALQTVLRELLTRATVVADATGIPAALSGITRDVEYEKSTLMTVHRVDGDTDYYYLANARHAENRKITDIDVDVWLTAQSRNAVPRLLDAWTGDISGVPFERSGNRVRVRATLKPGQSMLIALRPGRITVPPVQVSTGETTALSRWDLEVEDWQPSGVSRHRVTLEALAPWSTIPGLEDVSGVGTYRTSFDVPRGLKAWLDLGEVTDTCRVRVNGRALPPADVLDPVVDLGPWLRTGRNTVEVEVASTLLNRLRTTSPEVFGIAARQAYGLIGPVQLRWYR
ncbi:glycosyl hydrolase [Symbioplanes lichenis]|uniref:glycosyl hydrolase n=1 Tax=Symbioplanes lichenis TaxID=1629072 RepID=UPI00273973DB|nr:glycosyl hydrolase [Actinoplanes lichenis]